MNYNIESLVHDGESLKIKNVSHKRNIKTIILLFCFILPTDENIHQCLGDNTKKTIQYPTRSSKKSEKSPKNIKTVILLFNDKRILLFDPSEI